MLGCFALVACITGIVTAKYPDRSPTFRRAKFPAETLESLLNDLENNRPSGRAVAAFDADGTLWDHDVGEAFFEYQIDHQLVSLPPDPWAHFEMLARNSPELAYGWLARSLDGVPLVTARAWADEAFAARPPAIFDAQQRILTKLRQLDVEIFVVTASVTWAVEPGARALGIPIDHVIGVRTVVDAKGVITDELEGVVPYRQGKVDALLARTGGRVPYFVAGNSEGDLNLLESSSALRLVISSARERDELWATESALLQVARQRGWYSHRY